MADFLDNLGKLGKALGDALEKQQLQERQEARFRAMQAFELFKQRRAQEHSLDVARFSAQLADKRQLRRLELDKEIATANRLHQGEMREIARKKLDLMKRTQSNKQEEQRLSRVKEILAVTNKAITAQKQNLEAAVLLGKDKALPQMRIAAANINKIARDQVALLKREGLMDSSNNLTVSSSTKKFDPDRAALERSLRTGIDKAKEAQELANQATSISGDSLKSEQQIISENVTPSIGDQITAIAKSIFTLQKATPEQIAKERSKALKDRPNTPNIGDQVTSIARNVLAAEGTTPTEVKAEREEQLRFSKLEKALKRLREGQAGKTKIPETIETNIGDEITAIAREILSRRPTTSKEVAKERKEQQKKSALERSIRERESLETVRNVQPLSFDPVSLLAFPQPGIDTRKTRPDIGEKIIEELNRRLRRGF